MRLALVLIALALTASGAAHAKCGRPVPFITPRPGSVVPPNPVFFLFFPEFGVREPGFAELWARALDEEGRDLPTALVREPGEGLWSVVRVAVTAPAGTTVHFPKVFFGGREPPGWTVSEVATRGATTVEFTPGPDEKSAWACSFTSHRVFRSTVNAPAYRIEFAPTEGELRAGRARVVVLPGAEEPVVPGRPIGPGPAGLVQLGHESCVGWSFEWPAQRLAVRITALSEGRELRFPRVFLVDKPPDWNEVVKSLRSAPHDEEKAEAPAPTK